MKIKNLSKEDLELMSYNDIADLLLKDEKEQTTADLFKKICYLLGMTKKEYENKIGGFYTSLTTDKRFILLDSGKWDLKENHSIKSLKIDEIMDDIEDIDTDETFDDVEDEEEEKISSYDENPDDDQEDPADDYKDLVIVDEEDLDNLE